MPNPLYADRYGAGAQGWMLRGACLQADPELFFPIAAKGPAERQIAAAKAICGRCPVRANCLSYALEAMPEGIWGGTTRDERSGRQRDRHPAWSAVPASGVRQLP